MKTTSTGNVGRQAIGVLIGASLICAAAAGCRGPDPFDRPRTGFLNCTVVRQECAISDLLTGQCVSVNEGSVVFKASICYDPIADTRPSDEICMSEFCNFGGLDAPGDCFATSIGNQAPPPGICNAAPAGTGRAQVVVDYHGEQCTKVQNFCFYGPKDITETVCLDVTRAAALNLVGTPGDWISRARHIASFTPNAPACVPPQAAMRFQVTLGPIATGSGAGVSATMTAVRGQASVVQTCDLDVGCLPSSLDSFRADLADTTVAGIPLTNLSVSSIGSPTILRMVDTNGSLFDGIPADGLQLRVEGKMNGGMKFFTARNTSIWRVDASTTAFRLRGALAFDNLGSNGTSLPIAVNADVAGVPASAQALACAGSSSLAQLFGFEDPIRWTSDQATLFLVTSPITQGCGGLGVKGQGFLPIDSSVFTTRGLTTNAAASIDLYVPSSQPNPSWQGAVQMYLSCPSGNLFHQFIAQVELTGKPQKHFSTLRFPLPSSVRTVLAAPHDDCTIGLALNVNNTNQTWVFDNFRFTP